MDPVVIAAWAAAVGAASSALVNTYVTAIGNRHKIEMELVVSALNHFVGGSQQRNAGIAALRVLSGVAAKSSPKRPWPRARSRSKGSSTWHKYGGAVGRLFCGQVVYILSHGSNRWKAHEIANVVAMVDWLLNDRSLGLNIKRDGVDLAASMKTYVSDWNAAQARRLERKSRGSEFDGCSVEAVTFLVRKIEEEWIQELGMKPARHAGIWRVPDV